MTTKQQLSDQITDLCQQAACSPKLAKIHFHQYVHHRWNPHPPRAFLSWWNLDHAHLTEILIQRTWIGIDPILAFNCEAVREVYRQHTLQTQPANDHPCQGDLEDLIHA